VVRHEKIPLRDDESIAGDVLKCIGDTKKFRKFREVL
jgi:hypothetical protein